jgi:hypothetical protein
MSASPTISSRAILRNEAKIIGSPLVRSGACLQAPSVGSFNGQRFRLQFHQWRDDTVAERPSAKTVSEILIPLLAAFLVNEIAYGHATPHGAS